MQTKLTLTVDQDVIESAKEYAKKNQRSLSNIIEEYLKSLTETRNTKRKPKLSKIVKALKGSVKDPDSTKSYKEILADALIEKHLK
jgi:predicted CopG family antitoxin